MGTLHEDVCIFMIVFCSIIPKMRNVSDKSSIIFPENRVVYEIMWKNMVKPDGPKVTI
jgi:hypothetical protein